MPFTKYNTTSHPINKIKTEIGDLYIFCLRGKEMLEIENQLSKSKKSIDDFKEKELLQLYLPYFIHLKKDLVGDDLKRPENYTLTDKAINTLSNKELEDIAKMFLEENDYLTKNIDREKEKTNIEYFYKVILEEDKIHKETFKKLSSVFSPNLSNNILKTIRIGDKLKNISTLSKSLSFQRDLIPKVDIEIPKIDIEEMVRKKEERRIAPFKELSSKMDDMIEAENKTVSFMDDMYNTQIGMATELKNSSDSANKNSILNIIFTIIIIFLTIISFVYPIWFNNDSSKIIETNNSINKRLETLIEISRKQTKLYNQKINKLKLEIDNLKAKNNVSKKVDENAK
jgi:hypothetical protein